MGLDESENVSKYEVFTGNYTYTQKKYQKNIKLEFKIEPKT